MEIKILSALAIKILRESIMLIRVSWKIYLLLREILKADLMTSLVNIIILQSMVTKV